MTGSWGPGRATRTMAAAVAALALGACHGDPRKPPPEALVVSANALLTTEGGTGASFDAVLASTPMAPVEVEVRSEDPTEGLVFAPGYAGAAAARGLTFTPQDWSVPRRVVVQPVDDAAADGTVTYPVRLRVAYSEDGAYGAAPGAEVRVTNVDDDAAGITIELEGGAPLRTDERGGTARFTIWLASAPVNHVYIPVVVGDPTEGLLGSPYYANTIAFWVTAVDWHVPLTVTVSGQPDGIADGDQEYTITVGPLQGDAAYAALPAQKIAVVNVDSP